MSNLVTGLRLNFIDLLTRYFELMKSGLEPMKRFNSYFAGKIYKIKFYRCLVTKCSHTYSHSIVNSIIIQVKTFLCIISIPYIIALFVIILF